MTRRAAYEAAKADHKDWLRRLNIADGQDASEKLLARLQGEADAALERRRAAFRAFMDSDE